MGLLHHTNKVVHPGRSFLHRMLDLHKGRPREAIVQSLLSIELLWWRTFVSSWNAISYFPPPEAAFEFALDVSSAWGCSAWLRNLWFHMCWSTTSALLIIAIKELIPIIAVAVIWGPMWRRGQQVCCHCDNMAVVQVLNTCTAQDSQLMHMLRCFHFIEAAYYFVLVASHVPGKLNELASDLSCNRLSILLQKTSWAYPQPSHIPQPFLLALLDPCWDWTSETWTNLFRDTVTWC